MAARAISEADLQAALGPFDELVGQRNLAATANAYTHALSDGREVDYQALP